MKKQLLALIGLVLLSGSGWAQVMDKIINEADVRAIEQVLASDSMEGRRTFTPAIDRAAGFIANEFAKAKLKYFDSLTSYRQDFYLTRVKPRSASAIVNGKEQAAANIIAFTADSSLTLTEKSTYPVIVLDTGKSAFEEAAKYIRSRSGAIIFVPLSRQKDISDLRRFRIDYSEPRPPVFVIATDESPATFTLNIMQDVTQVRLSNVVGVLPGKAKKDELVIFSGHYDHLGIGKPNDAADSIYNGANDDAAGTTAVIMLAKYFAGLQNNERTLVFVAFTGEEVGGYGSKYFSKQINPDKAMAMFNIEMIGTESKWGRNSAYITGYEKSDFGKLLQDNLSKTQFRFYPDPYTKQNLFYRSDNATLAALGVPAHTISTSKMDDEKFYHTPEDEIETLDMQNMTEIIKAIALSSMEIISGRQTPTRVERR